jgi:hypothetical protein
MEQRIMLHRIPRCLAILAVLGCLLPARARAGDDPSANLILNPGNDEPLVGGEIPHWEEIVGTGWTQGLDSPQAGIAKFKAGNADLVELHQEVDVSAWAPLIDAGLQVFAFSGYVMSFAQTPTDTTRIRVEYRPYAGAPLATFDTGQVAYTEWQEFADTRTAPAGTRIIRIRLTAQKNNGTVNDGYFDSFSLIALPWVNLGGGLAGSSGIPSLEGTGSLAAGSPGSLAFSEALPLASTVLLMSLANTPTPFKGGTLSTVPVAFQLPLISMPDGKWTVTWPEWPAGIPSGFELYFQVAVPDPAAPQGVAISNLLRATQP